MTCPPVRSLNSKTAKASAGDLHDSCKDAESVQPYRSKEIDSLSGDVVELLAGWCRLGQQGDSIPWDKVFCISYALVIVPVESLEDIMGSC